MAEVLFEKASLVYPGADRPSVDELDLAIEDGEFMVLVGPSGCGKSTTLRMLAGLEEVDSGRILIGDRDVTDVPPKDRDIAMVFQNYALYPHMSAAENMGFALKLAGASTAERTKRVAEVAELLETTVAAVDPIAILSIVDNAELDAIAREVRSRVERAVAQVWAA